MGVFRENPVLNIEGFRVALPEVLLLLKTQAAKERWNAEKGVKDRADIISSLSFVDIKYDLRCDLFPGDYPKKALLGTILRTLRESRVDYEFLGLNYSKGGVKLKKLVEKEIGLTSG
ncbi:MAG: hypothetical protein ACP5PX_01845 [Candidatus Hadarchaeum sp.]|uniref:hypothetical protein n=1 Tax=Candidatus Hadarchaeum sp. TaxID=2883567 RepID=UPI003D0E8F0B